ncbi:MAG: zf-HC2 domain-containing protein [Planctomycetota bacterium]|nr:zf-HC2 domain-containing protein [Planctomycetota bacterium]
MSTCDDVRAELSACLDGEVSPAVRAACDEHLRGCEDCRAALAELQAVSAEVAGLPRLKAPATLAADVRRAIAAQPPSVDFLGLARSAAQPPASTAAPRSLWGPIAFGIAALMMLCALAFVVLPVLSGNPHYRAASARDERAEKARKLARAAPAAPAAPRRAKPAAAEAEARDAVEAAPVAADRGNAAEVTVELRKAKAEPLPGAEQPDNEEAAKNAVVAPAAPPAVAPPAPPPPAAAPAPVEAKVAETRAGRSVPSTATAPAQGETTRRAVTAAGQLDEKSRGVAVGARPALTPAEQSKPAAVAGKARGSDRVADKILALKEQKDAGLAAAVEKESEAPRPADAQDQVGREANRAEPEANRKRELVAAAKALAGMPKAKLPPAKPEADGAGVPATGEALGDAFAADKKTNDAAPGPAKESAPRQSKGAFAAKDVGETVAAGETPPARPPDPAASQKMGKGFGAGGMKPAPAEVIVYKTRDPARLIAQLRGLAAENAARWEAGDNFGPRTDKAGGGRSEKKSAQSNAAPSAPPTSMVFEIVTTPRQRAAIMAKLRELQSSQMPLGQLQRGEAQAGAQAREPRNADAPASQAAQTLKPEEGQTVERQAKQTEAAQQSAEGVAQLPAVQERAGAEREVRIRIRIDPWPANE